MIALLELAERCEAASGADIWLDADIRNALGLQSDYSVEWTGWGYDDAGKAIDRPKAYPYTASLDAAMTLVPDDALFSVGRGPQGHFAYVSFVGGPICATPALALCAAALRARASAEQ